MTFSINAEAIDKLKLDPQNVTGYVQEWIAWAFEYPERVVIDNITVHDLTSFTAQLDG